VQDIIAESPDPIRLGGICKVLETQLEQHVRSEIRSTILGHVQRGGTPTAFDRTLATAYGSYAAAMVADGQYGRMAALQQNQLTSVPLGSVANKTRTVPRDAPMVAAALAVGTSFGVSDFDLRLEGDEASTAVT
jgi:6-phosphofructokinase 1